MISKILRTVSVLMFLSGSVTTVQANYGEFLEKLNLEEMYRVLGPKDLLATFSNKGINFDGACRADLLSYTNGIKMKELWALKMLDSSSKIPAGLLIGNIIEMGMYDECMSVYVNKNGIKIRGNHCIYALFLSYRNKTLPINPMLSICMPISCEEEDLSRILEKRLQDIEGYKTFNITDIEVLCTKEHSRGWTGAIITATVIGIIFLTLVICTILDWLQQKKVLSIQIPQLFSEVSLYKSTMDIFNFKDSPDSISALHGLRFLSISIVIFGHGILIRAASLHANNLHLAYLPPRQSITIAFVMYSVDTFLTISGFLMSYSFLKKYTPLKEKFNLGKYYLHRYIRLTPAIAAVLCVTMYIVPLIGSGPLWRKATKILLSDICQEKWWTILFYVNNVVYKEGHCLPHLWSTAVDMQLFWISPFILYPLAKTPKIALSILGILFIASVVTPAAVIALNNFPFSFYEVEACFTLMLKMWTSLYTQAYTRASPWLIGIFLGYLVVNGPKELKKSTVFIGWVMTAASLLFCVAGFWTLLKLDYMYNVTWESTFGAISRPIWSAAMSWIIFTSVRGYGGQVNKFLSSPIFFPLSRLSYCLYIVHIVVQMTNSHTSRTPSYFLLFPQITAFINDLIISLVIAYFFCVVIEIPTRSLEKIIFRQATVNLAPKKQDTQLVKENLHNNDGTKNGVDSNCFKKQNSTKKTL